MRYACDVCQKVYGRKVRACERCGSQSLHERDAPGFQNAARANSETIPHIKTSTPWDEVLSGGAVRRSTMLVYGPPGVGKTHEGLRLANAIARRLGGSVAVASAEMPMRLVLAYLKKLDADADRFDVYHGKHWRRARGGLGKARVVLVDSLQTFTSSPKEARELLHDLEELDAVRIVLARVNAEGAAAGGKDASHDVDTTVGITSDAFVVDKDRFGDRKCPFSVPRDRADAA